MSDTAHQVDELEKKDRYLQWREHMRKAAPVPATPPTRAATGSDWSPDALFNDDTF